MAEPNTFQNACRYLIPLPKQIEPAGGSYHWPQTISFEFWGELCARSGMHLAELGWKLDEELGLKLEEAPPEAETEPQLQIFLDPLIPPGFRETDFPQAGGPLRHDSYLLAIGEQITLWAGGEPGLYYGLESLLQLFRSGVRSRTIPGLVIRDVPAFPHRMVQYDIAREQTVRMEYLKHVIRRLASLKVNQVMLYLEYRYRWKSHPAFGPPGSLTAAQARELTEYARSYSVDLVPQVNVLGHVEGFLRHDQYAHLREVPEDPFQLCPLNPASYELFKELIEEMLPHFESEFFHVGGDESFLLGGCPRCREKAAKEGMAALYADHMVKFHDLLTGHGKRMMIWGDIILQHREIADRLPKDVVIFDWHYHSSSPETLDFFRDRGFEVYAASSLGGYETNHLVPPWDRVDRNTGPFFRDAASRSLFGACFTTWEMFFGNFFQNNWYPIIYGASAAWNPEEASEGGFADRFGLAFMDDQQNACVQILRILADQLPRIWKGFAGESRAQRIRSVFFDPDPLLLPRLVAQELTEDQLTQTVEALDRASHLLEAARKRDLRNADLLDWLEFLIRMHLSVVTRIRALRDAQQAYAKALDLHRDRSPKVVPQIVTCIEALLTISDDLSYYLTQQATAIERYGSSNYDSERYHRHVQTLDAYISKCLTLLHAFPDMELPEMGEMGWEETAGR